MAEKVLLIKLKTTAEGQPVIAAFGRSLNEVASSENRLQREMRETSTAARSQTSALSGATSSLKGWIAAAGGLAAAGAIARGVFSYHQDVEATTNSIAGLLFASQQYVDSTGRAVSETVAWQAANAEAAVTMEQLQRESLKTAATVPQIAAAYATTYGAIMAGGIKATNDEILQLTVRLTQAGNAFQVPMEQMRQEINSLLTGQITEDSMIAKRLGLDNKSIKQMQANGTLVGEVMRRTEAYALAAEAQSNSVRGKLLNTIESVTATLAKAFGPVIQKMKGGLDAISTFASGTGAGVAEWTGRVAAGVERIVSRITAWVTENGTLIASVGALAAAVLVVSQAVAVVNAALVIANSTASRFMLTAIAIALVWEGVRKLAPIEIGGSTIGGYVSAVATGLFGLVGTIGAALGGLVFLVLQGIKTAIAVSFREVGIAVGDLGELLGLDWLRDAGRNAAAFWEGAGGHVNRLADSTQKAIDQVKELGAATVTATKAAFGQSELPSIADMAGGAISAAIDRVKTLMPELEAAVKPKLDAHAADREGGPKPADGKALARLEKDKAEYLNFIDGFRSAAEAAGDPLSQTLAKIETDRAAAIRKFEEQKKQLKGAVGVNFAADETAINEHFNTKALDQWYGEVRKVIEKVAREQEVLAELTTSIAIEGQERTTAKRLALISDEIERERQTRVAEADTWLEQKLAMIEKEIEGEATKTKAIEVVQAEYRARLVAADQDAQDRIQENLVGTTAYWNKLAEAVKAQFRGISKIIADTVLESRRLLSGAVNGFLDDILDGQASLTDSIGDLSKGLAKIWTKNFTDILLSGKNVFGQLKEMMKGMHVQSGGKTDYMGTAMQGAGFGGAVGGMFQTENNYAGVGGAIGGALGAVVGAYFGGAAGAKVGLMIGTAIGTAIGSMITKGKDEIKVAIVNGVVTVTEKGISAEARNEVQTQIQRQVKAEMKAWRALFDRFPEHVKKELERLKQLMPRLDLTGAVEEADITDQNALDQLSDFLGQKLPRATFAAYSGGIRTALEMMGVGQARLTGLFDHWATLQGSELQEAVRSYINTMLDAVEIRDLMSAPFEDRFNEARRRSSATPITQMDDLDSRIQMAVASMAQLTDVDDIIAAQQHVNDLARQRYEMEIQYLQRIDQIGRQLSESIANQREQIQVAGMTDQQKLDHFFQRMVDLRGQLAGATDPEEISRLTQMIQSYVSQAMGVAPGNEDLRRRLLEILGDVDGMSQNQLAKARKEVEERDGKTAQALQTAAEMLMKAAADLSGSGPRMPPPGERGPGGGDQDRRRGVDPGDRRSNIMANPPSGGSEPGAAWLGRVMEMSARQQDIDVLLRLLQEQRSGGTQPAAMPTPEQFADAVRRAMSEVQFVVTEGIHIDGAALVAQAVHESTRTVYARLRANPDALQPRTGVGR